MKSALAAFLVATTVLAYPAAAGATAIEYQTANLGGSVWRYDYFITSGTFDAQQGFVVFFDEGLYAGLQPVLPNPADWDVLTTNPDTVLQSSGTYDALALVSNPLFIGPFSGFTWLGLAGTVPGSQIFDVYAPDASGFPEPIESGVTTPRGAPTVPEPSTWLLVAAAGAGWRLRARRRAAGSA